MQNNVSLCTIVKNSEDTIDMWCSWAIDNFTEINIVVDDENTDQTLEKCNQWANSSDSINLYVHKFDNFSSQKQRAYDMCTKPFAILIDADEILEELPPDGLESTMEKSGTDVGVLMRYNLQKNVQHYNRTLYPDSQLRLIRMSSTIKMNGKLVDESLDVPINTKLTMLPWHIIHYGHIRPTDALKLKGKDRIIFADVDVCDGDALKQHGEDMFIERNKEWDTDKFLAKVPKRILAHSRKYWK
jgi:glycosyltransferase involved in cell wall biosynthesis